MSKADTIMDILVDILSQASYKLEDIHLINYNTWKSIEKDMERALRTQGLELSFDSDYSEKYDIKLSGNAGGIVSGFRYFYNKNPKYGWQKTKVTEDLIEQAKEFYEEDRYGYANKISKETFIKLVSTEQSGSKHIGIGSQASILNTIINIYVDNYNNLMYSKNVIIYD